MDILINKAFAGKNIKQLLIGEMGYSSRMLKRLKFSPDGILVNGQFRTVRYELKEGDILSIACEDTNEDTSPYIIPVDLKIGIAYEDEHITIANKPPFMPAHPSLGHRDDTVANALAFRYNEKPYVFRPVNRLDRDTSGLMITANTRLAAFKLYQSMINGEIKKAYIAILDNTPQKKCDILISHMARCSDSIVKRKICDENEPDAKIAITAYRTIAETDNYAVVLASPVSGRTHQLRLHFSEMGCPITGDTMYGEKNESIPRHALHSAYTSFPHPESKETISLYSPLPEDMAAILGKTTVERIQSILPEEISMLMVQINDYEKV
ncbi:MAG: RluA family pseudouridine synthase [Clostridia bacterium]|nr:RluA family pseudouridine synthase [Clostridia bacterium]